MIKSQLNFTYFKIHVISAELTLKLESIKYTYTNWLADPCPLISVNTPHIVTVSMVTATVEWYATRDYCSHSSCIVSPKKDITKRTASKMASTFFILQDTLDKLVLSFPWASDVPLVILVP